MTSNRGRVTRRRLLAGGTALAAGLAGCLSSDDSATDTPAGSATPRGDGSGEAVATSPAAGLDLPVDDSDLRRETGEDAIPAIVDPAFGSDWSGLDITFRGRFGGRQTIEPRLDPDDQVIGINRGDAARAYPFRVLNWHEIVNDSFGGPLLVTYCPLCRSALTTERRVDGETTVFGVSGLLYREALVMYDEATESLWSQLAARAIQGPMTGSSLDLTRATITTWGSWQEQHPDTEVLLPPPESSTVAGEETTRDYSRNPYARYQESASAGLGGLFDDDRLNPKAEVVGIANNNVSRAYSAGTVTEAGVITDSVGGLPVVVTTTPDGTPVAWVREVDDETLSFEAADERHLTAGGSRWTRTTGRAVDGPYEGTRLTQANAVSSLFWFAWLDIHPDTELYGN